MQTLTDKEVKHRHRWGDKDPRDRFAVGYIRSIRIADGPVLFMLQDDGVTERWWAHCEKVTEQQGMDLLKREEMVK